jgi:hypothetical protein
MNDLKQVKDKLISVLAPEFPDMDVAQYKACVRCTGTLGRDQVLSLSSNNGFIYPLYPSIGLYKRKACGPKTSIYANRKIETLDGRIWYCRTSHQYTGRCKSYGNDTTKVIGRRLYL